MSPWVEALTAISAIVTPLLIASFGALLAYRQSRSELLLKVRFDYYERLAPDLNRLMCYLTFIGTWRDDSPPEIALKRRMDASFHVAAPLFSSAVGDAYRHFMSLSFRPFGLWGQDAPIRSSALRRKSTWTRTDVEWDDSWSRYFELKDDEEISPQSLAELRRAHDQLVATLVKDLNISRARAEYTTTTVSFNAGGGPRPR